MTQYFQKIPMHVKSATSEFYISSGSLFKQLCVAMGVHFKQNVMCAHVQMEDPGRDPVIGAHSMIAEDPPSSLAEFMSDKKSR